MLLDATAMAEGNDRCGLGDKITRMYVGGSILRQETIILV
jgi:hypothetical protein